MMVDRVAPNASLIANSRARDATTYAITPYVPVRASTSASAANATINHRYNLKDDIDSSTMRSMVLTSKMASVGFVSRTAFRTASMIAVGGPSVCTTSVMPSSESWDQFWAIG